MKGKLLLIVSLLFCWPVMAATTVDSAQVEHGQRLGRLQDHINAGIAAREGAAGRFSTSEKGAAASGQLPAAIKLSLMSIEAVRLSEKRGDEIYFDILEFGDDRRPKHYHVPSYPHHWPSSILSKIKNVPLWQGQANEQGKLTLIVSMLDKDAPPWNPNDLVGAFKLVMSQKDGKPVFSIRSQSKDAVEKTYDGAFSAVLELSNGKATYKVEIKVE